MKTNPDTVLLINTDESSSFKEKEQPSTEEAIRKKATTIIASTWPHRALQRSLLDRPASFPCSNKEICLGVSMLAVALIGIGSLIYFYGN